MIFKNMTAPANGITKAGKNSSWNFLNDIYLSAYKAFRSTRVSQENPAIDSEKQFKGLTL